MYFVEIECEGKKIPEKIFGADSDEIAIASVEGDMKTIVEKYPNKTSVSLKDWDRLVKKW